MKEFNTIWSKDFFTKFSLVITWLIVLFLINYTIWYTISTRTNPYLMIILTLFIGLIFYNMLKLIKWVKYIFSEKWIKIIISPKRSYFLEKNNIDKLEKINKLPLLQWFWLKANPFKKEVSITTSKSNIVKIHLKDGKKILISPLLVPEYVFEYFNW